jgi:hypothetical protein
VPDRAASNEWAARLSLVAECGIGLSRHSRPHAVESAKTDGDSDSEPLSIERSREVLGAEAETKRSKRCALEPTRGHAYSSTPISINNGKNEFAGRDR